MKLNHFYWALFLLCAVVISGCGDGAGGGEGLNGAITVEAKATGSVITATATYTNPQVSNLIGVPISFSIKIGNITYDLGGGKTNNSGSISIFPFTPPVPFNGTQTITVIARTGSLTGISDPVIMTGRSLKFTAPTSLVLTTTEDPLVTPKLPFVLPTSPTFIAVTDPFITDLGGVVFTINRTISSGDPTDTLLLSGNTTSTNTGGAAAFPGATGTIAVPTTIGGVSTMTITWTVSDPTGLIGTGTTTVTLTRTAPVVIP